jgi:hypothetical protein
VQTPGHAVINLSLITAYGASDAAVPILLGAILPDVPISILYVREHYLHHVPDEVIWRDHYQRPFWQNLIHGMHSFPLSAAGLTISLALGSSFGAFFFASALLHALGDFPIHVEDAHRHFWPLSNYRFISPVSYWDLRYHAREVAAVELLCVSAACLWLWVRQISVPVHVALAAVMAWYALSYVRLILAKPVDPRARVA